jgi:DNA polymerase I-like protein with 3'-5' exonuclease and polymerase domains
LVATVVDVENTGQLIEEVNDKGNTSKRLDIRPFRGNSLVSVGYSRVDGDGLDADYLFFHHNEMPEDYDKAAAARKVQAALDKCSLFIAHNAKHDLLWLWASGFRYDGPVWDTAGVEYILARGQKTIKINLYDSAVRRGVELKRKDLTQEYLDNGIGFEAIPYDIVETYGRGDCVTTGQLYKAQLEELDKPENSGLRKTIGLQNRFCMTLARMEHAGIAVDLSVLDEVGDEYRAEQAELRDKLQAIVRNIMGDTPINLDSPEQLARVVYSRALKNKAAWAQMFVKDKQPINRKMKKDDWKRYVARNTVAIAQERAHQCTTCKGSGQTYRTKKGGTLYSRPNICRGCDGSGLQYKQLPKMAGFGFSAPNAHWATSNGFSTSKEELSILAGTARAKGMTEAEEFLEGVIRLSAIGTYLGSFVNGTKRSVILATGLLHASFNQTATATGRLSSSAPNMQNMPRGNTFPVKRAFVSRFPGGKITEADYSQLEFRCAVHQGNDPVGVQEVRKGVDVHQFTADTLTEAGEPRTRQEAKSRTFKPLYGGMSGTPAEVTYFQAFMQKYLGIAGWHVALQESAITTKKIVLPTGREYAFPYCKRTWNGGATQSTKIKNYPVQGFATADIVPWATVLLEQALIDGKYKSVLINTVHDSDVIDTHPDELETVPRLMYDVMSTIDKWLLTYYGISMIVPLDVEVSQGDNWLNLKKLDMKGDKKS